MTHMRLNCDSFESQQKPVVKVNWVSHMICSGFLFMEFPQQQPHLLPVELHILTNGPHRPLRHRNWYTSWHYCNLTLIKPSF